MLWGALSAIGPTGTGRCRTGQSVAGRSPPTATARPRFRRRGNAQCRPFSCAPAATEPRAGYRSFCRSVPLGPAHGMQAVGSRLKADRQDPTPCDPGKAAVRRPKLEGLGSARCCRRRRCCRSRTCCSVSGMPETVMPPKHSPMAACLRSCAVDSGAAVQDCVLTAKQSADMLSAPPQEGQG